MMSEALPIAQSHLNTSINDGRIHMIRGGQAQYPGGDSGFRPDWAGVKRPATSTEKSENVLPGDTKPSKVWSSAVIKLGEVEDDPKTVAWLRPLCHIFAYCVRCNARYGYLISDKELVVVWIHPGSQTSSRSAIEIERSLKSSISTPATRARNTGILEYQAIPWDNDWEAGDNRYKGMTVNLALWWLHMMAAEESAIEEHYTPLPGVIRKTEVGASTEADVNAKPDGDSQNHSFTYSDMSGAGRRLSNFDLESQGERPTPRRSLRGQKRDREDNVGQVTGKGKRLRS